LVLVGGDFARDASRARVGRSAFKRGSIFWAVDMPRSSCDHRALPPSGPPDGVRWCSLEGSASRPSLPATSPPESSRSWWCRRSCSSCCCWRSVTPWGLALFHHYLASRIFIMQPGRNLRPVVIHKDDYRPCGGEKRAGLRPPPALSFKDVHHPCWGGGRAELGLRLPRGLAARFFLQHSGEKGVRQPCEGGELWLCGVGRLRCRQLPRAWLLSLGGFGAASGAASCRLDGAWLSVHPTGDGCAVRRSATSTASPASPAAPGVVQDVVRRGGGGSVLGWSCPHSRSEDGSEDLFARVGQLPPIGAEVVAAAGGAEVVTAAGEAAHCGGGCLRWRDRQCHLLPDLRLFGFNGLVVAPRRKMGARTFPQRRTC
jgi:hypothetical protein